MVKAIHPIKCFEHNIQEKYRRMFAVDLFIELHDTFFASKCVFM